MFLRTALILVVAAFANLSPAEEPAAQPQEFTFGMLFVGPWNDHGWSQAHYGAGKYVERNIPGAKMLYVDKVNPADRPGTTPAQLAESLIAKGAKLIIFNSDDMKDGAIEFAKAHPEINVIHASGDSAWKEGKDFRDLPNLANVMGRMEYGEMIAGAAAALESKTGKIGYLGPLINDETRRLAVATYLGARYAWIKYRGRDPKELSFRVTWIGFWFNIPGVTADPTHAADDFYNDGYDVVLSGLDTTEVLAQAKKQKAEGKEVRAIPYDFVGACGEAPDVCLGVPYFNWGPDYVRLINSAMSGTWKPVFLWSAPDWSDINNPRRSSVGFQKGDALSAEASKKLDDFIHELAGGLNLWTGPLSFQDGSVYLKEGEAATDQQIWYLPQMLAGMEGQSVPTK